MLIVVPGTELRGIDAILGAKTPGVVRARMAAFRGSTHQNDAVRAPVSGQQGGSALRGRPPIPVTLAPLGSIITATEAAVCCYEAASHTRVAQWCRACVAHATWCDTGYGALATASCSTGGFVGAATCKTGNNPV